MALARKKQTQIPQPAEGEAAMARREAPPSIVQYMMVFLCTYLKCHQLVVWSSLLRLAACDEVWSGTADSVFDEVGYEESEDKRYEPAEDCNVRFVGAGTKDKGPEDEGREGHCTCINE
jgi:hypothetical protein